jgi:serine/threonine protein kinase
VETELSILFKPKMQDCGCDTLGIDSILSLFRSNDIIVLNGRRYEVLNKLADGGFASVYLVLDSVSKRQYAMKRISCQDQAARAVCLFFKGNYGNDHLYFHATDGVLDSWQWRSWMYSGSLTTQTFVNSGTVAWPPPKCALDKTTLFLFLNITQFVFVSSLPCSVKKKKRSLLHIQRGTLQDMIERMATEKEYMTETTILRIFLGICEGVACFHEAEPALAHRDIKVPSLFFFSLLSTLVPVCLEVNSECCCICSHTTCCLGKITDQF